MMQPTQPRHRCHRRTRPRPLLDGASVRCVVLGKQFLIDHPGHVPEQAYPLVFFHLEPTSYRVCVRALNFLTKRPRISRLLALALKMEQMMEGGVVKSDSELAQLGRVSTARITQIMNLLHLAPDIQEQILSPDCPTVKLRESGVRKLCSVVRWSEQRAGWQHLLTE